MTTLGIGTAAIPTTEARVSFRRGWLRHLQLGLSSAGGAAIVLAIFELLQRQPIEGFRLLSSWGPWPVVALVALVFLARFLSRMNDTVQTTFSSVVQSVQQGAQAQADGAKAQVKTADALSRLADQGGQQAEEVRRLTIYAAREFPSVYERLDRQDGVLSDIASAVHRLHTRLDERDKQWQAKETGQVSDDDGSGTHADKAAQGHDAEIRASGTRGAVSAFG